jgi:phosphate transport system ATP-binding protein
MATATAQPSVFDAQTASTPKVLVENVSCFYGSFRAVADVTVPINDRKITAIIGPSGCGKSTLLRSINRMNELVGGSVSGKLWLQGQDLYAADVDPVRVRQRIGMVFQKPNPFPRSIYENIAFGVRQHKLASRGEMDGVVENALRQAALWDEVKDKLHKSGLELSGGQQQRLCIARTISLQPDVILMDEPCAALDPIATGKIEDMMQTLKREFTIVIVTHNMQQASRASDYTMMMMMRPDRAGELIEFDETATVFTRPKDKRTEDYVSGRFG